MPIARIKEFFKKRAFKAVGRRISALDHVKSVEKHTTRDGFESLSWKVAPLSSQQVMLAMNGRARLSSGDSSKRLFQLRDAVVTAHYGRKGVERFTYTPRGGEFSRKHLKHAEQLAKLLK